MNVLIVDESDCDRTILRGLVRSFCAADIAEASNSTDALALLSGFDVDLAILPACGSACEERGTLFQSLRRSHRRAGLILVQHDASEPVSPTIDASVLKKPFSRACVAAAIRNAIGTDTAPKAA
ncbi:MAG: hypothetical protein AAFO89_02155 [Planctomycetota bacterium]